MNLLTVAGYYASGSSAVTDLLGEYEPVKSLGSGFECRIAHDMFGLSDLEYYLVDNHHRHNSSTAIKQFIRLMGIYGLDKRIRLENYPDCLGVDFDAMVKKYVNRLAPFTFNGGSHVDLYSESDFKIIILKLKERIYRTFNHNTITNDDTSWKSRKVSPYDKYMKSQTNYISYPRETFIEITRDFTKSLFSKYENSGVQYLLVDQLVPPSNTMRYIRYFENLKVVSVDRDPRDIYYLEKYYWRGGIVPTDVQRFVEWYKSTRNHKKFEKDDHKVVLRINFEDLIYDYESIVSSIESFVGLNPSQHQFPRKLLDPSISINNIGKWKNDHSERDNILYIENSLMKDYYASEMI